MRYSTIILIFCLTGCLINYSPEKLQNEFSDVALCGAAIDGGIYTRDTKSRMVDEINRRELISDHEWDMIRMSGFMNRPIEIGMSECAMLLVFNTAAYDVSETVYQGLVQRDYYFEYIENGLVVLVENGRVVSWSK